MQVIASQLEEINNDLNVFQTYMQGFPAKALHLGIRVIISIIILFIGSKLINLVRKILKKSLSQTKAEAGVITFLDGLVKFGLYILLVILIAQNLGFDATSLIALLGSIGVTIGLALQGSLSNFAGGVLILLLKPFRVGDYIMENCSGKEGTVTSISIFYTTLLTVDQKTVILPNGNLSNTSIINYSTSPTRRVDILMSISYGADIKKAKEVLLEVVKTEPKILKDKDITVYVDSLGSSEVVIGVRSFCNNKDYWQTKWDLTENMKYALDAANIEIPFPQMDIHMKA